MFIKNNSKRVITLNLGKRTVKIVPTFTAEISADEAKIIEADVVMASWVKDGSLVEAKTKADLSAEMVAYSSSKDLDSNYSIRELQSYAKSIQLDGYSNLDKAGLITLLKKPKEA